MESFVIKIFGGTGERDGMHAAKIDIELGSFGRAQ